MCSGRSFPSVRERCGCVALSKCGGTPHLPPGRPPAPQGGGQELEKRMALTNGDSFPPGHFPADGFAAAGGKAVGGGPASVEVVGCIGGYGALQGLEGLKGLAYIRVWGRVGSYGGLGDCSDLGALRWGCK